MTLAGEMDVQLPAMSPVDEEHAARTLYANILAAGVPQAELEGARVRFKKPFFGPSLWWGPFAYTSSGELHVRAARGTISIRYSINLVDWFVVFLLWALFGVGVGLVIGAPWTPVLQFELVIAGFYILVLVRTTGRCRSWIIRSLSRDVNG